MAVYKREVCDKLCSEEKVGIFRDGLPDGNIDTVSGTAREARYRPVFQATGKLSPRLRR